MRWKLDQQEKKLDSLFETVQNVEDEEQRALLSKFLCVRASGFVESSVRNLVSEFTNGTSPAQIQSYVNKEIKYVTNLKFSKLVEVLNDFDPNWAAQFQASVSDEQKAALNAVVSNRNNIAHGENDTISYLQMVAYYQGIKEVVRILKGIIKK